MKMTSQLKAARRFNNWIKTQILLSTKASLLNSLPFMALTLKFRCLSTMRLGLKWPQTKIWPWGSSRKMGFCKQVQKWKTRCYVNKPVKFTASTNSFNPVKFTSKVSRCTHWLTKLTKYQEWLSTRTLITFRSHKIPLISKLRRLFQ